METLPCGRGDELELPTLHASFFSPSYSATYSSFPISIYHHPSPNQHRLTSASTRYPPSNTNDETLFHTHISPQTKPNQKSQPQSPHHTNHTSQSKDSETFLFQPKNSTAQVASTTIQHDPGFF
ncbi:hypothetical protein GALMADRAFT_860789 [Galerina marginata CBS 339.88]|uniref:Uncharacterized protein n=1 Tax=Galerina marginata (strain CBS 339.88) TaxID=685588 RepID=A0A067TSV6_GALM3|nr:hypothetical protein GALMADRAFT_860789 [Galerina marginata CBS 339.88]